MVKLDYLHIENFQGHVDSKLEFGPGLNIIQGETNVGKSSIMRALNNLIKNQVRSAKHINHNAKSYNLTGGLDNGYVVRKERKETSNIYYITMKDGTIERHSSFGVGVPSIIPKIFESPDFVLDEKTSLSLNISEQLKPSFLLEESGPVKSKVLSKLTGGDVLELAIKKNQQAISKLKTREDTLQYQKETLEKQLIELDYVDTAIEKIEKLQSIIKQFEDLKVKFANVQSQIEKYKHNIQEIESLQNELSIIGLLNLDKLNVAFGKLVQDKNTVNAQENLLNEYNFSNKEISRIEEFLTKTQNVDLILRSISDTELKTNQLVKAQNSKIQYTNFESQLAENEKSLTAIQAVTNFNSDLGNLNAQKNTLNTQITLVTEYQEYSNRIVKGQSYITRIDNALSLVDKINEVQALQSKLANVTSRIQMIEVEKSKITQLTTDIKALEKLSKLEDSFTELKNKKEVIGQIFNITTDINKSNMDIAETNKSLEVLDQNIAHYEEQLKEFKVCPLCEQNIAH